jgi:hypothetical protein
VVRDMNADIVPQFVDRRIKRPQSQWNEALTVPKRIRLLRAASRRTTPSTSSTPIAPLCIGAGISILLAQIVWTTMPVATAFALIALGATVTTTRICKSQSSRICFAAQLLVYSSLYLLVIGAICDSAARSPNSGLTFSQIVDLSLSAIVMANAIRMWAATLLSHRDTPVA